MSSLPKRRALLLMLVVALLITPMSALAGPDADDAGDPDYLAATVENAYIRLNMSDRGSAVVFTTGGDPTYVGDENKRLLYVGGGDPTTASSTGTATVRVVGGGRVITAELRDMPLSSAPHVEGNALVAEWEISGVRVTQRVALTSNPFTGREDMARFSLTLTNITDDALEAGARLMLDLMIGDNDDAPILVPELGRLAYETELGDARYYRAFESPSFAADSLRALGIIRGYGLTDPDRVAFASWPWITDAPWDYTIDPSFPAGDSAAAYWWYPEPLAPGASVTYETLYGLGAGGGTTWFDGPAAVTCEDPTFQATLWVSNDSIAPLTDGETTLTLPEGLSLANGSTTMAFPDVPADGVASVTLNLVADLSQTATLTYTASTTFAEVSEPLVAERAIQVPSCAVTPTPTITPSPTPSSSMRFEAGPDTAADYRPGQVDVNYDQKGELPVRPDAIGQAYPLLGFDIAAIPADAEITQARLVTHVVRRSNDGPIAVRAAACPFAWDATTTAGSVGYAFHALDKTTLFPMMSEWQMLGPWSDEVVWDVTEIVQGWRDGEPNHGLVLLTLDEEGNSRHNVTYSIATHEWPEPELGAVLVVDLNLP